MKIGIIGLGMVGEAVAFGFRKVGHDVFGYDIDPAKGGVSWQELMGANVDVIFICVPTPSRQDGGCDTGTVWRIMAAVNSEWQNNGLVVIKSTVLPGATDDLARTFPGRRVAFCPEFLRERARFSDFYENQELLITGTYNTRDAEVIEAAHDKIAKHTVRMTPIEAELAKYFVNCFNAYRINFANAFYDVCQEVGARYDIIKDAVTTRADTKSAYLDCNENLREFGGACLPKDTMAFMKFVSQLGLCTQLFQNIVVENNRVSMGDVVQRVRSA